MLRNLLLAHPTRFGAWLVLVVGLAACQSTSSPTLSPRPPSPSASAVQAEPATVIAAPTTIPTMLSTPTGTTVPAPSGTVVSNSTATAEPTFELTETPTATVEPSATAESSSTPVATCTPGESAWTQMNPLIGFDLHAGIAESDGCRLWLVGEQVSPTRQGVLIHSDDGGPTIQTVAAWPQALHVWSIALSSDGALWIAGDTTEGRGLLLKSTDSGQNWMDIPLPIQTTVLTALAAGDEGVWVGGEDGSNAIMLVSADGGSNWREALRIPGPITPGPVAHLSAIASTSMTIIAVGTDGVQGVIAVSRDDGTSFQLATDLGEVTAFRGISLIDSEHAYVGGYFSATGRTENAVAVLLRANDGGATWTRVPTPDNAVMIADLLFRTFEQGYVILGSGGLYAANAGDGDTFTWETMPLVPEPIFGRPTHLFAASNGTVYALGIGGSGLYQITP